MRKTLPEAIGRVFSIDQLLWKLSLVLHEFLGCSQLVAHVTEQLLALLQKIEGIRAISAAGCYPSSA